MTLHVQDQYYNHFIFIILFPQYMQHLLRLLNYSIPDAKNNHSNLLPTLEQIRFNKKPFNLSIDSLGPGNNNFSLDSRIKQTKKPPIKAERMSHSQRIIADFQGRNSSIRISKHTYKRKNTPLIKSEPKINLTDDSEHIKTTEFMKGICKKPVILTINPEIQDKSHILSRRKKYYAGKREFRRQQDGKASRSIESKGLRVKKSKMLKLKGTGCRINQANALDVKIGVRPCHFRTLQA